MDQAEQKDTYKSCEKILSQKYEQKLWANNEQKFVNKSYQQICDTVANKNHSDKSCEQKLLTKSCKVKNKLFMSCWIKGVVWLKVGKNNHEHQFKEKLNKSCKQKLLTRVVRKVLNKSCSKKIWTIILNKHF